MKRFPEELGKLGFVFNFITYGGHQIDGLAAEEFATALKQDGMLSLARLQRKFRLLESPYRTPQTLVGGPRLDAALMAASGRTATTKAMGKGSTQHQHLVQTEVPPRCWRIGSNMGGVPSDPGPCAPVAPGRGRIRVPGAQHLERSQKVANVVFADVGPARPQAAFNSRSEHLRLALQKKRLMTLAHLFLIHRYKVGRSTTSAPPTTISTRRKR